MQETKIKQAGFEWGRYLKWVLAHGVASVPIGYWFWVSADNLANNLFGCASSLFAFGAAIGVAQYFLIRSQADQPARWAVATALGWGVGLMVALPISYIISIIVGVGGGEGLLAWPDEKGTVVGAAVFGMLTGFLIGMMQVIAAGKFGSGWNWIGLSTLGWGLGSVAAVMLYDVGSESAGGIFTPTACAATAALVTGTMLAYLRQLVAKGEPPTQGGDIANPA